MKSGQNTSIESIKAKIKDKTVTSQVLAELKLTNDDANELLTECIHYGLPAEVPLPLFDKITSFKAPLFDRVMKNQNDSLVLLANMYQFCKTPELRNSAMKCFIFDVWNAPLRWIQTDSYTYHNSKSEKLFKATYSDNLVKFIDKMIEKHLPNESCKYLNIAAGHQLHGHILNGRIAQVLHLLSLRIRPDNSIKISEIGSYVSDKKVARTLQEVLVIFQERDKLFKKQAFGSKEKATAAELYFKIAQYNKTYMRDNNPEIMLNYLDGSALNGNEQAKVLIIIWSLSMVCKRT